MQTSNFESLCFSHSHSVWGILLPTKKTIFVFIFPAEICFKSKQKMLLHLFVNECEICLSFKLMFSHKIFGIQSIFDSYLKQLAFDMRLFEILLLIESLKV